MHEFQFFSVCKTCIRILSANTLFTDIDILSAAERQCMYLLNTVFGYSSFAVIIQCSMKQIIFLD